MRLEWYTYRVGINEIRGETASLLRGTHSNLAGEMQFLTVQRFGMIRNIARDNIAAKFEQV